MKRTLLSTSLLIAAAAASAAPWTYRGTLNDAGKPANGSYDLRVTLLNEAMTASVSAPLTLLGVQVVNGNFAADVDFGIDLNNATAMALKTEVATAGSGGFVALGEATRFDPKAALAGVCWDTEGNAGTNPAVNFIGTTDFKNLVLKSNGIVMATFGAVDPNTFDAGNVIFGRQNFTRAGVIGATIGGGGNGFLGNIVTDNFGVIAGGQSNVAGDDSSVAPTTMNASFATVSGGASNHAGGLYSSIPGGLQNCAGGQYSWAGGRNAKVRVSNTQSSPLGGCNGVSISPINNQETGDQGTFVWSDSQGINFTSTDQNQFLVRAQGGMGLNTATLGAAVNLRSSELVVRNGVTGDNTDITLMNDTNRGYNLVSVPGTAGAAGTFAIGEVDARSAGVGFVNRLLIASNGDLSVSANAFKPGGGAWAVASDARLKTDVSNLDGSLDRLLALRGVNFSYRADAPKALTAAGPQIGFIAQEVERVFPLWISERDGYKTIGITGFEALTVEALRELRSESAVIDRAQADQIKALAAENAALKDQLAQQNAEFQARLKALEMAQ